MKDKQEKWKQRVEKAINSHFDTLTKIRGLCAELAGLVEKQSSLSSEDKKALASIKADLSVPPVQIRFD